MMYLRSLSLGDGSNGGLAANYTLNGSTRTLNITPRILNISGTRVYDGTTNAVSSDLTLSNLVGSETLALSGTGTITSANVGNNKSVSLNTLEINNDTGVASNYTLNGGTHQLVSQRSISMSGSRSYNGSTTVNSSDLSVFNNLVSGETLDITGSGTVSSANVGLSKSVTIGSLSLSNGTGSSANYTLGSATLDITQKSLTISGSKVYDGTNVIQGSNFSTFSGIVSGETLSMTGSGTVASGNIGNDKTVTNTSLQLLDGSGLASNYSIANTISADITLRPVNLSGSRVYDGTTDAAASDLSLGNLVSGENISLSGTGTLGSAAVGSQTITNIGSLAISDGSSSASNYSLTGALSMAITKRPVTVTGSKFYDGTTNAAASNLTSFTNLVSGETLSLSGNGSVASSAVGSNKSVSHQTLALANGSGAASNYSLGNVTININKRILSLDGIRAFDGNTTVSSSDISTFGNIVSGESLYSIRFRHCNECKCRDEQKLNSRVSKPSDGSGNASNYTLSGGIHTFDISQLSVNVTGSKIYDGTTTVNGSTLTLTNLVSGEAVSLTGSGSVASAAVGDNKTVSTGSLALTGAGSGNYTLSNYTTSFEIFQRPLSLSGSRVYDGSTNAVASDLSLSNLVSGETLSLSGTGSVLSAAVGSNKEISVGSLSLSNGSGTASNYTLTGGTHQLSISQRQITISGSRVYDGTTNASASDLTSFSNLVGSESLTLSGTGSVGTATPGSNKNVTLNDLSLISGTGVSSNYNLSSATLTIVQRPVNLSGTRVYDGSTNASASDLTTLGNLVSGETLNLSGTGTLASAAVGSDKSVSIGTLALSDGSGESDNYTLSGGTLELDVTTRNVTISGSKSYDGNNIVSNSSISTFNNLVSGESLTITGSGTISSGAVGSNKTISLGTLTLANGSGSASNYNLSGGTISVTRRVINLSGSKTYNGTTSITASDINTFGNIVTGETLSLSGTGSVSSSAAENNKTLTLGSIALSDGSGSVSNYTLSSGTHQVNITRRSVDLSGTRVYDGSTNASASDLTTLGNLVSGETLNLSGTGTLASAAVGSDKSVSIGTLALSDGSGESDNYTLSGGTLLLDVTQKDISLSGSRVYDGTNAANSGSFSTFSGLIGSETLSVSGSGTVSSALVESSKVVTLGDLALVDGSGAATNYNLNGATLTISKRPVNVTLTRVYDGTTNISGSDDPSIGNLIGNETLTLSGSGSIGSSNAANGKSVTLGSLALSSGTGSESNYTLTGGTHLANIDKRPVNLSGTRIYDGTTNASSSDLSSFGNLISGETLTLSGSGVLGSKDVGTNKSVGIGTLALGNNSGNANNYTLSDGTLQLSITPKSTTASGSRPYDGTTSAQGSDFSTFSGLISGDSMQLSGTGSFGTALVGSKGVTIGTLRSNNPNYYLSGATLIVSKRLFNLTGRRDPGGILSVNASELGFENLVSGESLVLSGVGYINNADELGSYTINRGTLSIGDGSGLASNYDFGNLVFNILRGRPGPRTRAGILLRLQQLENLNDKLLPSKTQHRSRMGLDRKVTVTTPDQSISVSPCTMTDGFCN